MSSSNDRPAEIYGLMVPLDKERLLVPRGCVAEVVGYQTPQEMTGAPPWHLGVINWNGRRIPDGVLRGLLRRRRGAAHAAVARGGAQRGLRSRGIRLHRHPLAGFPAAGAHQPRVPEARRRARFPRRRARWSASCSCWTRRRWCPTSTGSRPWSRRKPNRCPTGREAFSPAPGSPCIPLRRGSRRWPGPARSVARRWRSGAAGPDWR